MKAHMTEAKPCTAMPARPVPPLAALARREWSLLAALATAGLFLGFGKHWLADLSQPAWFAFMLAWLFAAILLSALAVVRHAESLAVKLGEPLGTLVLTLSVIGIEVMMIGALMSAGHGNAALARDAMFAVLMIVLNGMAGLCLLLGGIRYREQVYNLQGANSFLAVIVPLAVIGLILPDFTSSPGPTFSPLHAAFLIVMSVGLYGVFLAIQTARHRDYFLPPADAGPSAGHDEDEHCGHEVPARPFTTRRSCCLYLARRCTWPNRLPRRSTTASTCCTPRQVWAGWWSRCWCSSRRRWRLPVRRWATGCNGR